MYCLKGSGTMHEAHWFGGRCRRARRGAEDARHEVQDWTISPPLIAALTAAARFAQFSFASRLATWRLAP